MSDVVFRVAKLHSVKCASLRSEVSLLHAKLHDTESQKEKYHERLVAAEKRVDRLQSKTVAAMNPHKPAAKAEVRDESPQETPSSPTVSGSVNWWEFWPILILVLSPLIHS